MGSTIGYDGMTTGSNGSTSAVAFGASDSTSVFSVETKSSVGVADVGRETSGSGSAIASPNCSGIYT